MEKKFLFLYSLINSHVNKPRNMSANNPSKTFYSLVENKDFKKAFNFLEKYSFTTYENIISSTLNKIKEPLKEALVLSFFNDHLPKSIYFKDILISPRRRELFGHIYHYQHGNFEPLYKTLAYEKPEFLIELIKRHQIAFINKEHFIQIGKIELKGALEKFYWQSFLLSASELGYYSLALDQLKKLEKKSIGEILSLVSIWLFYYSYDLKLKDISSDKKAIRYNKAVLSMNVMLERIFYLRVDSEKIDGNDPIEFQNSIINSNDELPPYFEVFQAWKDWYIFINVYQQPFCFDDSFDFTINQEGKEEITRNEKQFEEFDLISKKYMFYDKLNEEDKTPFENTSGIDMNESELTLINMLIPIMIRSSRFLLNEHIDKLHLSETQIDLKLLLSLLTAKILPYKIFFQLIYKEKFKEKQNWKQILLSIQKESKSFRHMLPLSRSEKKLNYFHREYGGDIEVNEEKIGKCVEALSFNIDKYKPTKFNRFEPNFNLFEHFWFISNSKYYAFSQLINEIHIHTFISNLALKIHQKSNKDFRKEVSEMENLLTENINHDSIKTLSSQKYDFNINNEEFNGEIDSLIFDGKILLGIEFKRSNFRNTISDIAFENEIILIEAARQLDRFKSALKNNFRFKNKDSVSFKKVITTDIPFVGLIITTNFESDHKKIEDKYMKISWLEWKWLIENFDYSTGIQGILEKIHSNYFWEKIAKI
jgi:hypothetical protein